MSSLVTLASADDLRSFEIVCMAFHMIVFRKLIRRFVRLPAGQGPNSATSGEVDIYKFSTSHAFPIIVDFLPETLKRNRIGAVFLLDTVVSLQETWIKQFLVSRLHPPPATDAKKKTVLAISEVQRYVGWAIQDCLTKWRKKTDTARHNGQTVETSSEIVLVLEQMRLFHREAMLDDDYIKEYYLDSEQILNQGGLTLVAKAMFPWALCLMKEIRKHYGRESLQEYGNASIKRAVALVKKDDSVAQHFRRGLRDLPGYKDKDIAADLLSELHERLLMKVFHARINESITQYKATEMGKMTGQKGVTAVTFRAGLKANEEQKSKKGKEKVPCESNA